ncbi:putative quinol monooxygenase [Bradyrhizobium sp. SSUT112]|uniref:putative quinol monooxygenase n=1 Tax=Bradyrhizobium sp. SSUT112 TaxID=3040604 RepID=UPI00244A7796|nr:putative quinol monooxygenase [Bradyrhizobium sp. SSUT112]MDH2352300.1 putative quinol monooxygenase [Bradyrhizobium sp. SSUT112]
MSSDLDETIPPFHYYNEGFVVSISITAKVGEEDSVANILDSLVAPTMAEEGVKLFLPYRSLDDKAQFFIFELYFNKAGWDAHQQAPHFLEAIKELLPRCAKRERIPFIPFVGLPQSS